MPAQLLSRRELLAATALGVAGVQLSRFAPAAAGATCAAPPSFPPGISVGLQDFENWAREIRVPDLWTCAPRTAAEVAAVVNWAARRGWRVRPRGAMHGWSPMTVAPGSTCSGRVVLVDTTRHLTAVAMQPGGIIRAQAGATMDTVLATLERSGLALTAVPAPGDITVGGVLAINAHGTAAPARGERRATHASFGSLSNLVVSLTAIVWSSRRRRYVVRRFDRDERAIGALLVHLGRAFVVEAQLRATASVPLRCQTIIDIPAAELFAAPGSSGRTFASFFEETGRIETIQFPFTPNPWLKIWSLSPTKPPQARESTAPYNYVFSDNIPDEVAELVRTIIEGQGQLTPTFGALEYEVVRAGLIATQTGDLWGAPKNTQLYIKPTTIRETANGYAVICRRADVQRVVSEFHVQHTTLVERARARGSYPVNMPTEIRVTGLDRPGDIGIPGARTAALSTLRPRPDHPERDVAVWLDTLTFPTTAGSQAYYRELERWMFRNYRSYAHVRPEWSKGWGYSGRSAWDDPTMLGRTIPRAYRAGVSRAADFDWVRRELNALDPHRVFSSPLLDRLLP